jgi:hypothetical protein
MSIKIEPIPPQKEKSEPIELTAQDRNIIIFALGGLTALGFDESRKLTPLGQEALRVARKFGVTY